MDLLLEGLKSQWGYPLSLVKLGAKLTATDVKARKLV